MKANEPNKLVLIGNGFDLAHGLKTSYKNFLDWYMCKAFKETDSQHEYTDSLIEITNKYANSNTVFKRVPKTFEEVFMFIESTPNQSIKYNSNFFKQILELYKENNWADIEHYYFRLLKNLFSNVNLSDKKSAVNKLNKEFDFLIDQLIIYIKVVNEYIQHIPKLSTDSSNSNFNKIFFTKDQDLKVINFNYTETLTSKNYAKKDDIIHIHGRVVEMGINPIIFGYGDESDPAYQNIEDSGENMYLEHIKSFGYFKTNNYHKLLSYIDTAPYSVYILGHSCGLSDRVLLNEILEHQNCKKIEIFFHVKHDGSDNFKEITQEISRHFRPQNKNIMRRKIMDKNPKNIIPQKSF